MVVKIEEEKIEEFIVGLHGIIVQETKEAQASTEVTPERLIEIKQEVAAFLKDFRLREEYDFDEELKRAKVQYKHEFPIFCDELIRSFVGEDIKFPVFRPKEDLYIGRKMPFAEFVYKICTLESIDTLTFATKWGKYLKANQIYELAKREPKKIIEFIILLLENDNSGRRFEFVEAAVLMVENIEGIPDKAIDILAEYVALYGINEDKKRFADFLGMTVDDFDEKYWLKIKEYMNSLPKYEEIPLPKFID